MMRSAARTAGRLVSNVPKSFSESVIQNGCGTAMARSSAFVPDSIVKLCAPRLFRTSSLLKGDLQTMAASPSTTIDDKILLHLLADDDQGQTPRKTVEMLDKYIIGQADAKRAVAVALRNRWRRHKIAPDLAREIVPKNILMVGPTGCGKTEIARRLAKSCDAPFIKVEATKFTEVGFHGRDVDQIIRDLVDVAIVSQRAKARTKALSQVQTAVEDRILSGLTGENLVPNSVESFRKLLQDGQLEETEVTIEVRSEAAKSGGMNDTFDIVMKISDLRNQRAPAEKQKMTVKEARPILEEQELDKVINMESVTRGAIQAVENDGIVFIDEIDKLVSSPSSHPSGADASSEGVQRDLLPIIEGCAVSTKHGNVNTDHILFVCSGAFHSAKPSNMLAELQGRLPIRVTLQALTQEDFVRILTEPEHSILMQQKALMRTEGLDLTFTDAAVQEVARVATEANRTLDNIGARRLHTVLERIMEDISFSAPETVSEFRTNNTDGGMCSIVIDKEDVERKIGDMLTKADLSRYIL